MPLNTGRIDSIMTNTSQLVVCKFEVEGMLLPRSMRGCVGPIANFLPVMTVVHVWLDQTVWAMRAVFKHPNNQPTDSLDRALKFPTSFHSFSHSLLTLPYRSL